MTDIGRCDCVTISVMKDIQIVCDRHPHFFMNSTDGNYKCIAGYCDRHFDQQDGYFEFDEKNEKITDERKYRLCKSDQRYMALTNVKITNDKKTLIWVCPSETCQETRPYGVRGQLSLRESVWKTEPDGKQFYFDVDGLPEGQEAQIWNSRIGWQILLQVNGVPGECAGSYEDPEYALDFLNAKFWA